MQVIYLPQGTNRSWKFPGMVSVVIFILHDVIRNVKKSFKTPYNGKSSTSPSAYAEIAKVGEYLELNRIQSYCLDCDAGDAAIPARDLFVEGVKHLHTATAFKSFHPTVSTATFHKASDQPSSASQTAPTASETIDNLEQDEQLEDMEHEEEEPQDFGDIVIDYLLIDEDEFPTGAEGLAETIAHMRELVHTIIES